MKRYRNPLQASGSLPVCIRRVYRSEVREATGIFFVLGRDDESRLFELVVAEFLEGDGGRDGGEDGDVCEGERKRVKSPWSSAPISRRHRTRTQFDGKPRGEFHLDELPEFVEVLERGDDLQHVE